MRKKAPAASWIAVVKSARALFVKERAPVVSWIAATGLDRPSQVSTTVRGKEG